eukprot:8543973-Heterocapsa_arctica.AAC.1
MHENFEISGADLIAVPEDVGEQDLLGSTSVAALEWGPPGQEGPASGRQVPTAASPVDGVAADAKGPGDAEKANAARLVDLRGVAQPPPFSGDDTQWYEWRFKFQAITSLLDLRDVMKLAAAHPREIMEEELSKENTWKGRMLYSLLVTLVGGRGIGIVRQVPEGHGLEAWRRLVYEYEPPLATRFCAVLAALLTPTFTANTDFIDQLTDWERRVRNYEAMSGERMADTLKCAVVSSKAPIKIREFLRQSPVELTADYNQLRSAIRLYLARGRQYSSEGTMIEGMDVGAVMPGRSDKGAGKGKGGEAWRRLPPVGERVQPPQVRPGGFPQTPQ